MTNKHVVSKEVATALDSLKREYWTVTEVARTLTEQGGFRLSERQVLNDLPVHTVIQYITEGYEAEEQVADFVTLPDSEESINLDKVESLINDFKRWEQAEAFTYQDGLGDGVAYALDTLGIEIKGIN